MSTSNPSEPNFPPSATAPTRQTPAGKESISIALGLLLTLGLLGALVVSFVKAVAQYGGFPRGDRGWGYVTGATLGPFILACIVVGIYYAIRKARRTRRKVASYIVLWTLLFSFLPRQRSTAPKWPQSDQEMGQLMAQAYREAAGAIPPEHFSQDELVVTMREVFREVVRFRQQYDQEAAQFQTPEMKNLYAPTSFQNGKVIEETVRQLKNMASVEEKYSSMDRIFANVASRIGQKWPEPTKRSFLEGMQGALRQGQQARLAVFRKEREWINASVDLYAFVLDNFPAFSVRKDNILVGDEKTRDLFNQKLTQAVELHRQVLQVQEDLQQKQKAQIGKYGLNPSDLGGPQR